jgi:hypothetical protein
MPVPSGTPPSAFLGAPSLPALPTLRLGDYLPELPAGVAYSSPVVIFRTSEAAAAQFVVSAGAKGVRWNVRKSRKQNGNKARDTKAGACFSACLLEALLNHWHAQLHSVPTLKKHLGRPPVRAHSMNGPSGYSAHALASSSRRPTRTSRHGRSALITHPPRRRAATPKSTSAST